MKRSTVPHHALQHHRRYQDHAHQADESDREQLAQGERPPPVDTEDMVESGSDLREHLARGPENKNDIADTRPNVTLERSHLGHELGWHPVEQILKEELGPFFGGVRTERESADRHQKDRERQER